MNDITEFDSLVRGHEDSIIGAIVCDPSCAVEIAKVLQPSDFVGKVEREVFRLVHELHKQTPGFGVDAIVSEMRKRKLYSADYNIAWLGSLASRAVVNQAIAYDSHELLRLSKLRKIQRIAAESTSPKADPDLLLGELNECQTSTMNAEWQADDFLDLRGDAAYANRGTEIIKGVLRDGEVGLVVASSKEGKSWLAAQLGWCIISGTQFLGLDVVQGNVLLVDNELKPREIDFRHDQVAKAIGHKPKVGEMTVVSLRGKAGDVVMLASNILKMDLTNYRLIIIDALYKIIPDGKSENDNEAMGKLMNILQRIADKTSVPIIVVHHATKGDQSHKSTLDMAAGAGSFGRSLDSLLAIREHEAEGYNVCEFKTRTNKPAEPISISFDWPLWHAVTLTPELKRPGRQSETQQAKADEAARQSILAAIPEQPKSIQQNRLREKFEFGVGKFGRLLGGLVQSKQIRIRRKKVGSKELVFYARAKSDSGFDSGSDSGIS